MRSETNYSLSEEDKKLAKRENMSLVRAIYTFLMAAAFGVIAFFALWRLKDAVPLFIVSVTPDTRQSDPSRLITYATIAVSGVIWFISFSALWIKLQKQESLKKCVKPLIIWCGCAVLILAISEILIRLAFTI